MRQIGDVVRLGVKGNSKIHESTAAKSTALHLNLINRVAWYHARYRTSIRPSGAAGGNPTFTSNILQNIFKNKTALTPTMVLLFLSSAWLTDWTWIEYTKCHYYLPLSSEPMQSPLHMSWTQQSFSLESRFVTPPPPLPFPVFFLSFFLSFFFSFFLFSV